MTWTKPKYTDDWKISESQRQEYAKLRFSQMTDDEQYYLSDHANRLVEKCKRLSFWGAMFLLLALGSYMNEKAVRV